MDAGDIVEKLSGYRFDGVVLTTFLTMQGKLRVVVEMCDFEANGIIKGTGLLHIFDEKQLQKKNRE